MRIMVLILYRLFSIREAATSDNGTTMKKVVIAGSASLVDGNEKWVEYWNQQEDCTVTDYPLPIPKDRFLNEYPSVFQNFFLHLQDTDILFVANEEKGGIPGYIGAEVFGEILFAVALNRTGQRKIEIILANMPSNTVQAYEELQLWLDLKWIKLSSSQGV